MNKKIVGILVCLLFVGVGVFQSISALAKNDVKEDSSKTTSQSLWPPKFPVVGIMKVINSSNEDLYVRAIFVIWPFFAMKPFKYYRLAGFSGYANNYIVYGICYDIYEILSP
jgi:hypothetical protein